MVAATAAISSGAAAATGAASFAAGASLIALAGDVLLRQRGAHGNSGAHDAPLAPTVLHSKLPKIGMPKLGQLPKPSLPKAPSLPLPKLGGGGGRGRKPQQQQQQRRSSSAPSSGARGSSAGVRVRAAGPGGLPEGPTLEMPGSQRIMAQGKGYNVFPGRRLPGKNMQGFLDMARGMRS